MTNPLDSLQQFSQADLPASQPVSKRHSSGRRELRSAILSRGITITARARSASEQEKAILRGEACLTLPVKRKTEKYDGLSRKEWKQARREARNDTNGQAS